MDEPMLALRDPQRGDIIVFEFPLDRDKSYFKRRDFIKRVIGLPGDRIEVRNKQVLVNGEPYRLPQEVHKEADIVPGHLQPRDFMGPVEVPADHYFVMGDNRDRSFDSRFWGFVPKNTIKGLAFIKYWSWDGERNWPRWSRIGRLID
jgi:signal peptidase I